MAVCAAIIGKDNSPKYFTCVNPDEELSFQYKVLSSLDVVEEKLNNGNKSDSRELYLGLLYSLERHKIYGYVTNTKIKFIIVKLIHHYVTMKCGLCFENYIQFMLIMSAIHFTFPMNQSLQSKNFMYFY
ncbi:hypothetical protein PPYR_00287 [Photinus pyralis]|uniref:Uncharacterized protein n=1 Tax=Photinus pyralis TaxID=7054 RepID=A0A5N4B144_PHOPY|nr:hypothetical protein PPYR_00287 [Photinus pyralis]